MQELVNHRDRLLGPVRIVRVGRLVAQLPVTEVGQGLANDPGIGRVPHLVCEVHLPQGVGIGGNLGQLPLDHLDGQLVGELERLDRGGSELLSETGVRTAEVAVQIVEAPLKLSDGSRDE